MGDYSELRGRCHELAEAEIAKDPSVMLVRGWYHCPFWGKQAHWWAVKPDGTIVDPSARQFPSMGHGEYEPFDGTVICDECGRALPDNEALYDGNGHYAFCSLKCNGKFIGLGESYADCNCWRRRKEHDAK